jgi:hypothetical protein
LEPEKTVRSQQIAGGTEEHPGRQGSKTEIPQSGRNMPTANSERKRKERAEKTGRAKRGLFSKWIFFLTILNPRALNGSVAIPDAQVNRCI